MEPSHLGTIPACESADGLCCDAAFMSSSSTLHSFCQYSLVEITHRTLPAPDQAAAKSIVGLPRCLGAGTNAEWLGETRRLAGGSGHGLAEGRPAGGQREGVGLQGEPHVVPAGNTIRGRKREGLGFKETETIRLEKNMDLLGWAILFLVVAIVAGLLGFTGIAGGAATIARVMFGIFIVVFVIFLLMGITGACVVTANANSPAAIGAEVSVANAGTMLATAA